MKLLTLIVFSLALVFPYCANAQHPMDFVSEDALAVVLIKDADIVNSSLQHISEQGDFLDGSELTSLLSKYVYPFIKDSTSIDYSEDILIVLEPTILADGQRPTGMFGPMPHLVVICKPKVGHELSLNKSSKFASGIMRDGWFIGSPKTEWAEPSSSGRSPLVDLLPDDAKIEIAIDVNRLWQQFGAVVQMTGGMFINTMNKPNADGIIPADTKNNTRQARKAFAELMKWIGSIDTFIASADLANYELNTMLQFVLKSPTDSVIDNASLLEMSSYLSDDMIQYGMSSSFTSKLLEYDFSSLNESGGFDVPPMLLTQSIKMLGNLSKDNVASYNLSKNNGLTIAALSEVEKQNEYMSKIHEIMDESTGIFLNDFSMEVNPNSKEQNTWDIVMVSDDSQDKKVMNAVFPEGDQWRYSKLGKNRIATAIGPPSWKPLTQKHSTPLAQLIRNYENLAIDFALTFDARSFMYGFTEVAKVAGTADGFGSISASPSTRISLIMGNTANSTIIDIDANLIGIAKLSSDISNAKN